MTNTATSRSSFSYSVLAYVTEDLKQLSVPVGVVLWGENPDNTRIRIIQEGEKVKGVKSPAHVFIRLAKAKIENWILHGVLPYATRDLRPGTDEWWRHVSKLLVHGVRLSEPRAIDCLDVDKEIELLYEAVVSPQRKSTERHERIDWELTRTLGQVAARLEKGEVAGFRGRPVHVKGFKEDQQRLLVIEGVNLATAAAEQDADALVSRLLRIRDANGTGNAREVVACVGYLTSPSGLNGEAFLVEWIQRKAEAKTFDLVRESDTFVAEVEGQLSLLHERPQQDSFNL
jgi:hypothetical protein